MKSDYHTLVQININIPNFLIVRGLPLATPRSQIKAFAKTTEKRLLMIKTVGFGHVPSLRIATKQSMSYVFVNGRVKVYLITQL